VHQYLVLVHFGSVRIRFMTPPFTRCNRDQAMLIHTITEDLQIVRRGLRRMGM